MRSRDQNNVDRNVASAGVAIPRVYVLFILQCVFYLSIYIRYIFTFVFTKVGVRVISGFLVFEIPKRHIGI